MRTVVNTIIDFIVLAAVIGIAVLVWLWVARAWVELGAARSRRRAALSVEAASERLAASADDRAWLMAGSRR